ncbi:MULTISPECIES: ROK family transcriptional regulator [Bacillaceae]|uniref:ROK family transcriptional regulator n=1 Tax=Evansella alkalicola TaxID=745819 RepID=A0ABS6JT80_9BACI|nr:MULTISPECIES: ROK family transcriptional regulator [Bacillaceae]MBU9721772.1 ROK family transcriptional regulator [Bacillus alkalicola]
MRWNQHIVKVNNKSLVLHTIKQHAPLSRADIANKLGLTKGTVSTLVNELLEEKLCYETGPGESSGGRPPVMLLFNQTAGYSIGIDLGVNYILGVLTDLDGNIIDEKMINFNQLTYDETLSLIKETIHFLINSAPKSHYGVIGIGVGVPGIINKSGDILLAPNLGWKNINLQREIEVEFQLPTIIENEANAGAYGEKCFGAGKEIEDLIYISAGIGIGVGFILNDELYRGGNGFSGELGHMIIEIDGKQCSCGSKGCWELYASEKSILKEAEKYIDGECAISEKHHKLETLIDETKKSEHFVPVFEQAGYYLGIGINNIINTFNPKQIIIGNRLAMAKEWLEDPLKEVIENYTLKQHQTNLQITFAELSIYSAALGVSAYATENFLKTDVLKQQEGQN